MIRLNIQKVKGYNRALDGLRGFFLLFVVMYHFYPGFFIVKLGWTGVDGFFVLSGYLITGILYDTLNHDKYWSNFFMRRVLRIFPLYYGVILLLVCSMLMFPVFFAEKGVDVNWFFSNQIWYWLYIINWKMFMENSKLLVFISHFWSLAIEEQFYLIWPFVLMLFRRINLHRLPMYLLSSIAFIIVFRFIFIFVLDYEGFGLYAFTIARIDALIIGAIIAVGLRNKEYKGMFERNTIWVFVASLCIFFLGMILSHSTSPFSIFNQVFGYTNIAIIYGCIIVFCTCDNKIFHFFRKITESKVLVFFGKYSYSQYVFHLMFFLLFGDIVLSFLSDMGLSPMSADLVMPLIILFITIAASLWSWYSFERKFLKLKSNFQY